MAYFSNRASKNEGLLHKYQDQIDNVKKLLDDLGWDYDRMSSSGKETLNKIYKTLEMKEVK